jgi:hypothetical protein
MEQELVEQDLVEQDLVEQDLMEQGTHAERHRDVLDEVELEEDAADLVRALVIATHLHDRDERARCTELLDACEWSEASLLLAAAKEVAIERHRVAIESEGVEVWLRRTAGELVEQHRDWMRLVPGQVMTMLRSALGKHELALMVKRSVRGRLDATCVQHLLATSLDYRDVFTDELDGVLKEATVTASRPVFAQEFAEG